MADTVHERLAAGPVLIVPPWDEPPRPLQGGGVRRGRVLQPEAVLLEECRPSRAKGLFLATAWLMPEEAHDASRTARRTIAGSLPSRSTGITCRAVVRDGRHSPRPTLDSGVAVAVFQAKRQQVAPCTADLPRARQARSQKRSRRISGSSRHSAKSRGAIQVRDPASAGPPRRACGSSGMTLTMLARPAADLANYGGGGAARSAFPSACLAPGIPSGAGPGAPVLRR